MKLRTLLLVHAGDRRTIGGSNRTVALVLKHPERIAELLVLCLAASGGATAGTETEYSLSCGISKTLGCVFVGVARR